MPTGPTVRLNAALEGRYRIERQIGEGGMATVYLARDTKHKRHVALKVLKPDLAAAVGAARFLAEIETTANLQHPHIVPLFDSGEADSFLFYVMPYVEGESLRGRLEREPSLPVDEAVGIVTKVAEALDHAHRQGVLHRDIKPANILLSRGGAMLSDFGIARAVGQLAEDPPTFKGHNSGTPAYMSPEQMAGDVSLDARSDLYSLACVLYELLAGEPPQVASTPHGLMAKRFEQTPRRISEVRPGVPEHIAEALSRALRRDRRDRIGSVLQFAGDLRTAKAQIVLFPIANHSPESEHDWFGDALSVELGQELAGVQDLRVVQADSPGPSKGAELGRLVTGFNASHALIGSARFEGDKYEVDVALVGAEDGAELWSHQFTGTLISGNQFKIQNQIANAVVRRLPEGLHLPGRSGERPSPEAEPFFWEAQSAWQNRSPARLLAAEALFKQATEKDPRFARAHVGLASVYIVLGGADYATRPPSELYPRALDAAGRALELRPDLWEAHAVVGNCLMSYDWNWQAAESHFQQALDLNPGYSSGHQWYSNFLMYRGRPDEAFLHARRALAASDSKYLRSSLARHYLFIGDAATAIQKFREALEMDGAFRSALIGLALAELHAGRPDVCLGHVDAMAAAIPSKVPLLQAIRAHVLGRLGRETEAREILAWLETPGPYIPSEFVALGYLGLEDYDRSLTWLEAACASRSHAMAAIAMEPLVTPLHGQPRFEAIVEAVHGPGRARPTPG